MGNTYRVTIELITQGESIKMQLGFGTSLQAKPIYIKANEGFLWYFVENENVVPIPQPRITGYLTGLEIRKFESENYGDRYKLVIKINADRPYAIYSGLDTWFSKSFLLRAKELTEQQLHEPISIEVYRSREKKTICFCALYDTRGIRIASTYQWQRDSEGKIVDDVNWESLIESLNQRIGIITEDYQMDSEIGEILEPMP